MPAAGRLTTHVLDTAAGIPAAGVTVSLSRVEPGGEPGKLIVTATNSDGRTGEPLLAGEELTPGRYELEFEIGAYFAARGLELSDPPFLDRVRVDFGIADPLGAYHVPLLVSPWSDSVYRGS